MVPLSHIIRDQLCSRDTELVAVSIRLSARDLSHVIMLAVCTPPLLTLLLHPPALLLHLWRLLPCLALPQSPTSHRQKGAGWVRLLPPSDPTVAAPSGSG